MTSPKRQEVAVQARVARGPSPVAALPTPARPGRRPSHVPIRVIAVTEDLAHYFVALVLMGVAVVVLLNTARQLATTTVPFASAAATAVNGVLFAIIIMETCAPSSRTLIAAVCNSNHF